MEEKTIYTLFRASDAEQASYSLLERLNAGALLFASETEDYRKKDSPSRIFWNAVHIVFDNRIFKYSLTNSEGLDKHEAKTRQNKFNAEKAKPDSALNSFMTAGYWNPFAWLEALSLFWVNLATLNYNPLAQTGLSAWGAIAQIVLASFVHAISKTVNLVCTPLFIILLGSAVAAFGFTPIVTACTAFAGLASIISVVYHYNKSKQLYKDFDYTAAPMSHWVAGLRHLIASLVIGIVQPVVRLYERARDLYHTHPTFFWLGALVVTVAVLTFAVFPYVGAPAIAGFELGGLINQLFNPLLNKLAEHFVLTSLESTIFKTAVVLVTTLGVADLLTRAVKEVAGWFDLIAAQLAGEKIKPQGQPTRTHSFVHIIDVRPSEMRLELNGTPVIQKSLSEAPNIASEYATYEPCFFRYQVDRSAQSRTDAHPSAPAPRNR